LVISPTDPSVIADFFVLHQLAVNYVCPLALIPRTPDGELGLRLSTRREEKGTIFWFSHGPIMKTMTATEGGKFRVRILFQEQ
jgi:hypothetical protein